MGEASSRLGLYSGNQKEAILDPWEQQLFVLTQGLCEFCGAHCGLEIKNTPSRLQLPQPREGGVFRQGPAASRVKSKFFSTLAGHLICAGCMTAASFVTGGLHFAWVVWRFEEMGALSLGC